MIQITHNALNVLLNVKLAKKENVKVAQKQDN
jgi:hypothetical protein